MAFHAAGDKAAANVQMQLFPKLSTCSPPNCNILPTTKRRKSRGLLFMVAQLEVAVE
jgi:hypothetical protein